MARKKRKKKRHTPCFVFTPETLSITQKAIKLFEQPLQRADHQDAKVLFAEKTVQQVKGKLDKMEQSVGWMCLTTFDYNEKIVIAQAIRLYMFDTMALPSTTKRQRELQQCWQIAAHFAADNP